MTIGDTLAGSRIVDVAYECGRMVWWLEDGRIIREEDK